MRNDDELLAAVPEFISVGDMLKATPSMEGGRRILYLEASNEGLDQQSEVVAAKALADSAGYFKRYGNIDLEHYTLLGRPNPAKGYPGFPGAELYEIGRPIEVRQNGQITFVKGEIYAGEGQAAERANAFWSSLTEMNPPARWYPSVAGAIPPGGKRVVIDPETKMRKAIVTQVKWSNIGMSKTPVNQHVRECATVPFGAFAKCWGAGGIDLSKALEASYATDAAAKTGGAALGAQSIDRGVSSYWDFREKLAGEVRSGAVKNPRAGDLVAHAVERFGMSHDEAAEYVERFLRDLKNGLNKRSNP